MKPPKHKKLKAPQKRKALPPVKLHSSPPQRKLVRQNAIGDVYSWRGAKWVCYALENDGDARVKNLDEQAIVQYMTVDPRRNPAFRTEGRIGTIDQFSSERNDRSRETLTSGRKDTMKNKKQKNGTSKREFCEKLLMKGGLTKTQVVEAARKEWPDWKLSSAVNYVGWCASYSLPSQGKKSRHVLEGRIVRKDAQKPSSHRKTPVETRKTVKTVASVKKAAAKKAAPVKADKKSKAEKKSGGKPEIIKAVTPPPPVKKTMPPPVKKVEPEPEPEDVGTDPEIGITE